MVFDSVFVRYSQLSLKIVKSNLGLLQNMILSDLILSDPGFKYFLKSDTLICLKKQIYLFISFRDKTLEPKASC